MEINISSISSPASLFKQCLYFISKNIGCVDSFNDFPIEIAKEIFDECLKNGFLLENNALTCNAIELFAEAYSFEFASSLKCSNPYIVEDYGNVLVKLIQPISLLDLSNSGLTDNNVILPYLHKLTHLKNLSLKKVNLTEVGWRKIFLPAKVFGGFSVLNTLDVSENCLSLQTLKTILEMKNLACICLSFSSNHNDKKNSLNDKLNSLKRKEFRIDVSSDNSAVFNSFENSGWGMQLLTKWQENIKDEIKELQKIKEKCSNNSEPGSLKQFSFGQFYKKKKFFKYLSLNAKETSLPDKLEYETYTYKRKLPSDVDMNSAKRKIDVPHKKDSKKQRLALKDKNYDLDLIRKYL